MVLEELNIPYETEFLDFSDLKKSPFVDVNPNGRVPAIQVFGPYHLFVAPS